MKDLGHIQTDKQIKELDQQIQTVYAEASRDIQAKLDEFNRKFDAKNDIKFKEWKDGKITKEEYDRWIRGQVFQGQQWEAKRDQVLQTITNSNKIAADIINGRVQNVFAFNATYMNYTIEKGAGINFGFGIYDNATVAKLLKDDPQMLPEWKIDEPKDYIWNQKQVNNAVTQGIIQGENIHEISKRIYKGLVMRNENLSKTFARTSMTGAQNAGRQASLKNAENMGIQVYKQWMATLDGHTRDSHAELDGESVPVDQPFSNGLMYPADPSGEPSEVYNCRCTMVGDLKKYPAEYERYDNIDGKPIKNMTYLEWVKAKGIDVKQKEKPVIINSFQSALGVAKTVQEINDLMNGQNWWRDKEWGIEEADLTGCDLDSAKSIAASYNQVFERYPQLKGKLDAPDAHPVGMKDNTYAWCYLRKFGKVQVNPNIYNDWSSISRKYEKDVESGWHPYATTAESIVTHEIGHAIDGLLAREGIAGGVTASGQLTLASSTLRNKVMKRCAKLDKEIAKYWDAKDWNGKADKFYQSYAVEMSVSQYATKDNKEWFAECFAEYITSANPRIVATEFGKELEVLLSKLGGAK